MFTYILVAASPSATITPRAAAQTSDLQKVIQQALDYGASQYNISWTAAVTLVHADGSPPTVAAAAAGINDHATGSTVTAASLFPGGSANKPYTSSAVMRLHEAGTIDIDAPVHQYIDPWLYNQSCTEKSLLELWNGDTTINVVSARMLMNMRSGIADYNDAALLQWTIDNPANDFNPIDFVRNVSKKFRFLPDTGGLYSGVGYVMLGWLLASVTPAAATGWDKLDQSTLLGTALSDFHSTAIWMKDGSCSKYPGVTHQYVYHPQYSSSSSSDTATAGPPRELAPPSATCAAHQQWYPGTAIVAGTLVGSKTYTVGDATGCCSSADPMKVELWTWEQNGLGGTCYFYNSYKGSAHWANSTSGSTTRPTLLSDFVDLYDASCLNGWTMGNIAATASDISNFYGALYSGKIVKNETLTTMLNFSKLTMGTDPPPGTPYGLGLFEEDITMQFDPSVTTCGSLAYCECEGGTMEGAEYVTSAAARLTADIRRGSRGNHARPKGCYFRATGWGHGGLDWGSGFPSSGFVNIGEKGVGYALGGNTGEGAPLGMNISKSIPENKQGFGLIRCILVQAMVQSVLGADYPGFVCS